MTLGYTLLLIGIALFVLLTAAAYTVYWERKLCAFIQQRPGPNRVGPMGLLQPLADVIKLLLKEDIVPKAGDKVIHFLAPVISVTIAFSTFAVIPFAKTSEFTLVIADVNIGMLFLLAMTSIGVYGITLSGWSSNSKYALMGGLRSSAQMISYELSMGLAAVSVILYTNAFGDEGVGYLSLSSVVEAQRGHWNILINPIAFLIFTTCAFAETNRAPFDLVEAEQELVGGFHTEYSSMKFAVFFLAEYINVIVASMVITTLFLGGYLGPFDAMMGVPDWSIGAQIGWGVGMFSLKVFLMVTVFIWVRWTLPRFKYNQLMGLGWKRFLPISILNLLVVAVVCYVYLYLKR
jgi:NADH-quinone oxidoreductase subunit H